MEISRTKTRLEPPKAQEVVSGLGLRWPIEPFTVRKPGVESVRQVRERLDASATAMDGIVTFEWDGQEQKFAIEYKPSATPQVIENAILQLGRYLTPSSDLRPLIVAPFLKPGLLDRLVREGISGVDLCGNLAITVPGRWLVMRTGARNRYPSSAPIKNIYRGKSALVCRALMRTGEYATATAIAEEVGAAAGVTLPTVSKVLAVLEQELIVSRTEGVRLTQPTLLLDNLVKNFSPPRESRRVTGKLDRAAAGLGADEGTTTRFNINADAAGVRYALDTPARYTVLPTSRDVLRVYTTSIDALTRGLPIDVDSRFPDMEIVETDDPSAYYQRTWEFDTWWIAPLQAYLQLATGGKREQQAADLIREDLLAFRFR